MCERPGVFPAVVAALGATLAAGTDPRVGEPQIPTWRGLTNDVVGNGSVWDKVNYDLVSSRPAQSDAQKDPAIEDNRRFWRRTRPILDVVASGLWLYTALKVFVVDVDRAILGSLADYRFFGFLAVLVVMILVFRRWDRLAGAAGYLLLFPLIVLLWKIPRALYRTKSWVAAFAVMNVFSTILSDLKYTMLFTATGFFAALAVFAGSSAYVLGAGGVAVAALLSMTIARTTWSTIRPSRFLSLQQRAITHAVNMSASPALQPGSPEWRGIDDDKFSAEQQEAFVQSLSYGVLVHRALRFWAFQLDQYRKSPASLFFSAMSFLALVGQTAIAFTLINKAVYEIDHGGFTYEAAPSLVILLRYSLVSMTAGEIEALQAHSTLANAVSIAAAFLGVVILLALFLSLFLTFRQTRSEDDIKGTVDDIRREGQRLEERLRQDFEVSAAEGMERLRQLGSSLLGVIGFFASRTPAEFEQEFLESCDAPRDDDQEDTTPPP